MKKSVIVYYSRTGNTKRIAEAMAQTIQIEALPLNLIKKGRKTKQELAIEKELWLQAISAAEEAAMVFIGTPTEMRRPHQLVMKFAQKADIKNAAVFCTYYGMLGATLIDMEAILRQCGTQFIGGLALRVGTDKYRFHRDVSQYIDQITDAHINQAREFARGFLQPVEPIELRMQGLCGRDCRQCSKYKKQQCDGAGIQCWSGRHCYIFECCVLKKNLLGCEQCTNSPSCRRRDIPFGTKAN
jgi:flavodoxin